MHRRHQMNKEEASTVERELLLKRSREVERQLARTGRGGSSRDLFHPCSLLGRNPFRLRRPTQPWPGLHAVRTPDVDVERRPTEELRLARRRGEGRRPQGVRSADTSTFALTPEQTASAKRA